MIATPVAIGLYPAGAIRSLPWRQAGDPANRLKLPLTTAANAANRRPKSLILLCGGPGKTRTCDLRFRKPLLYPAELRDHASFSSSFNGLCHRTIDGLYVGGDLHTIQV